MEENLEEEPIVVVVGTALEHKEVVVVSVVEMEENMEGELIVVVVVAAAAVDYKEVVVVSVVADYK